MRIAVTGCGWLGLPLAKELALSDHDIVATRRLKNDVKALTILGFTGIQFSLGDNLYSENLAPIFNCDLLVLNIPVGRKSQAADNFIENIESLLHYASRSKIQHLIFVSTTSVYGSSSGHITEQSPVNPVTESAKINVKIEQLLSTYFGDKGTILRLAGLVGSDRHPAKYLAGKTDLTHPQQVVNLIHQTDVIKAIRKIIEKNVWGDMLLLCAQTHPTRDSYYTWAANKLGLTAPQFVTMDDKADKGKIIDGTKSLSKLDMQLDYPSPYDML